MLPGALESWSLEPDGQLDPPQVAGQIPRLEDDVVEARPQGDCVLKIPGLWGHVSSLDREGRELRVCGATADFHSPVRRRRRNWFDTELRNLSVQPEAPSELRSGCIRVDQRCLHPVDTVLYLPRENRLNSPRGLAPRNRPFEAVEAKGGRVRDEVEGRIEEVNSDEGWREPVPLSVAGFKAKVRRKARARMRRSE